MMEGEEKENKALDVDDTIKSKTAIQKSSLKQKITNFFKDKYNVAFVIVLLIAFIIRLYYFFQTYNQPVWWDEATYLIKAKSWIFGLPDSGWAPHRAIGLSILWAIFYKFGANEIILRLVELTFSITGIFITYFIGKEFYNKRVGLIASFLMSVFWLHLFYTNRLLVGLPTATLWLFSIYLFWKGYVKHENKNYLWLAGLIVGIAYLFYQLTAVLLLIFAFYLILTEKLAFLKKKEIWYTITGFLVIFIPLCIHNFINYGTISPRFIQFMPVLEQAPNNFLNFFGYMRLFPLYLTWALLPIFLIGFIYSLDFFLGLDLIWKQKTNSLKSNVFIFFWILLPLLVWSYIAYSGKPVEPRYLHPVFPAVFILIAIGSLKLSAWLKKYNKYLAHLTIILLLLIGGAMQLIQADQTMAIKKNSYLQVKDAALWLKENTNPDDKIISASITQTTYYSERETISPNKFKSKKDFIEFLEEEKPKYLIISIFERHPNWIYDFPQEHNLTIAKSYFADKMQTKPILVIYELN